MTGQDWFILGFAAFIFIALMAIPLVAGNPDAHDEHTEDNAR